MAFLSKLQVKQMIDSRPTGVTPEGVVAALRARGNQIEGLNAQDTRMQGAFQAPDVAHSHMDFANPFADGIGGAATKLFNETGKAVSMPFKVGYNTANEVYQMGKSILSDPGKAVGGLVQTGLGAAENAYGTVANDTNQLFGTQLPTTVPTFNPDGTVTNAGPSSEQRVASSVGQDYLKRYGVSSLAKGDVAGAAQDLYKTGYESPLRTAGEVVGVQQGSAGLLKGSGFTNAGAAVEHFNPIGDFANDVIGPIADNTPLIGKFTRGIGKSVDAIIDDGIAKGIRPTVSGQDTLAGRTRYTENSRTAVKTIVQNKNNLALLDENGEALPAGSLPQNVDQFSQALDQTKKQIYKEYNDLQVQAGQQGMKVSLHPLADELFKLADDPTIQDLAPGVAEYARGRADALLRRGEYTPEQAQSAAQVLNGKLQAFYKNPNPNDISVSMVDALIKNQLTDGIDNAVMEVTNSEQYMPLRQRYGALKSIEKDLNHRAVVFARQSNKGFFDLSNVFSYGDVVKGVLSGSPATVSKGLVQKSIAEYYKYMNNPNTIVNGMFKGVDRGISGAIPEAGTSVLQGQPEALPPSKPIDQGLRTSPPTVPQASNAVNVLEGENRPVGLHGEGSLADLSQASGEPSLGGITMKEYDSIKAAETSYIAQGMDPKQALNLARENFLKGKVK